MADPREQQQGVVLPPGYENEQVVHNEAAQQGDVSLPEGYEGSQVVPGTTKTEPQKSWGPRAVEAIGNLVPEGAPAAAQKAQEAVGSVVPEWSIKPLAGFQKWVNEPLNKLGQAGAQFGGELAHDVLGGVQTLTHPVETLNAALPSPYGPKPATKAPEQIFQEEHPVIHGVATTIGQAAGGAIADPRMWPMMGAAEAGPLIQKALAGGFGTQMTKDAADAATELMATWDDITPEQRAQLAARAGLSTIFATLSAAHLAGPENVGKVAKGAKKLGGDLMRGEEGANIGQRVKKPSNVVTGTEQYEPKNLPAPKGTELPAPADRAPYVEPTPLAPEPGLVGPDYFEGEFEAPRQGKLKFPQVPRIEYAEPTPSGPGPEVATGSDQYDIRNFPKVTGATAVEEPKSNGFKTPYGTIDVESMTPSSQAGFPEAKVQEKPITREEVKSSPGTSMGEERRATGERRVSEQPYEGEERRQAERRASLTKPTEVEAALKSGKPVKTAFDVTEGAMDTIKRDQAMPKHPAEEAKAKSDAVVKHIESGKKFAILQAENPQNTRISEAENAKLTQQLKQELIDKGYKPVEVGGNTKDVEGIKEHAFFVPDISAEDAAELGRKYKQQGIVTHEGLRDLNTNKVDPLDLSKGLVKGDAARAQQYYTTIGNEDYHFPMKEGEAQNPVRDAADTVNKNLGKAKVNNERAELDPRRNEIADAYDAMKHDPTNPKVKAAYDALKDETLDQWRELEKQGYTMEPSKEDPYKSYEEMAKDVKDNKRIKVWTGGEPPADHPMSAIEPASGLTYNTIFRAVHDIMGHTAGDNDFSELGEENAWKRHAQSYSDRALPAMTTETKGQTSTFFNSERVRNGGKPDFPEQKANLLPEEFYKGEPKQVTKNASGESAASQEAINRTESQKAQGVKTYRVDTRSGKTTPISGVESADAKANPYEKIVQVKGDQITEQDSGKGARPLDEQKLLEQINKDNSTTKAQEAKVKEVAKPGRDTNFLEQVQNEPEWKSKSLSQQLQEAARRAAAHEAGLTGETNAEDDSRVKQHVFELSNANLKKMLGAVGLDPDAYDFSKREVPPGRKQKQPVERNKAIEDIMAKLTPEQIQQIGEQSRTLQQGAEVGGEPERSFKSRAEQAEQLLKHMWEQKPTDLAGKGKTTIRQDLGKLEPKGQFEAKGPAPEATPETAKMSDEELKKLGFTQADIDAGMHIPKVGGGGEGAATKMAGMEKIPENITKLFREDEIAGLKTPKSQETAAKQLMKVPAVQEWADIANLGAGERKWYQRGTAAAKAIAELLPQFFDKEGDTDKFLNVLASLSPRQAIAENFTEAIRVWKELKEAEKSGIDLNEKLTTKPPAGYPKDEEWTRAGKILWDNIGMNRKAKIPNALAALSGKSALEMWPDLKDNRYFKVPSFAANLAGFLDKVTSDGWMAAFAGIGEKELSNPSSYHPMAVMTRAAAEALGWEPAEAQAAIWAAVKTLTEKGTITPEGIRQYSQDFADIVKNDVQIRDMLKDMGVNLEELDGKLDKIEGRPEVTSRGTPTTEDSVRKLSERLEKQGREIPAGNEIERASDEARIKELSTEPKDYGKKIKSMKDKYGTTTDPLKAGFILPEGDMIKLQGEHDHMLGGKTTENTREDFIRDSGAIRTRYRMSRAGEEQVFSMPEEVTEDQVKQIRNAAGKLKYGRIVLETAGSKKHVIIDNPTGAKINESLKDMVKIKGAENEEDTSFNPEDFGTPKKKSAYGSAF